MERFYEDWQHVAVALQTNKDDWQAKYKEARGDLRIALRLLMAKVHNREEITEATINDLARKFNLTLYVA